MTALLDNRGTFNKKQALFALVFIALGTIFLQMPLTYLAGSQAKFTLFDAFGPVAGGFLGSMPGALSVFLMQVFNFVARGAHAQDVGTIIRLFPMMFAAAYFGKRTKLNIVLFRLLRYLPLWRTPWGEQCGFFLCFGLFQLPALSGKNVRFWPEA